MKNIFTYYLYRAVLLLLILFHLPEAAAQDSPMAAPQLLRSGSSVRGLFHLQADDGSQRYLRERNGALEFRSFDASKNHFYFWGVENTTDGTFQLYSARPENGGRPLEITTTGNTRFASTAEVEASQLSLGLIHPEDNDEEEGDATSAGKVLITKALPSGGTASCGCHVLEIDDIVRFKLVKADLKATDGFTHIVFEEVSEDSEGDIEQRDDRTTISQSSVSVPENYVSTNFFVTDLAKDAFKMKIKSGTEGILGFLHYTHHHFTKEVFAQARPQLGIKVKSGKISLIYRSGTQELPFTNKGIEHEVKTTFKTGKTITFGFENQDVFVAKQGSKTVELKGVVPAEFFINQTVSRTARMLLQLKKGQVDISYKPKSLVNTLDDKGTLAGSDFVSSDPYMPYNQGRELINTFDWQATQWPLRYQESGINEELVFSPFYSNETAFGGISAQFKGNGSYLGGEDFVAAEGWELVKAHLGYAADGTEVDPAPIFPYVLLYNRITGILRVFLYSKNESIANQLTVSLSMDSGKPGNISGDPDYSPRLWGGLQQMRALDETVASSYSRTVPYYSSPGRSWYFSDFVMEYDPCIDFFESSIQLTVTKTTSGDLTLVGRLEGGAIPAGTEEYDEWAEQDENFLLGVMDNDFGSLENTLGDVTLAQLEDFNAMDFTEEVTGTLVGAEIEDWEKEVALIEMEVAEGDAQAETANGILSIVGGVGDMLLGAATGGLLSSGLTGILTESNGGMFSGLLGVAGGITDLTGASRAKKLAYARKLEYENIRDKVKEDDQEIKLPVPPPRPQVVFGEIALKGKLTIETTLVPASFTATPGAKNSDDAPEFYTGNGSRGSVPLYNKPMGKLALLNTPEFGIAIIHNESFGYSAYLKTKEKPYIAHNNKVLGKIDDIPYFSYYIETFDREGKRVSGAASGAHSNVFTDDRLRPLPGELNISHLINWKQIDRNIADGGDLDDDITSWIKVSYSVWNIGMSHIKGRNLNRVFSNGNNLYAGRIRVEYKQESISSQFHFDKRAEQVANDKFDNYTFRDHSDWGSRYNIYNTQALFEDLMMEYCEALDKDAGRSNQRRDLPNTEGNVINEESLKTFPNPTRNVSRFHLTTSEKGSVIISLLNASGQELIRTENVVNGKEVLQGKLTLDSLTSGVYLLRAVLPSGKKMVQRIVKE